MPRLDKTFFTSKKIGRHHVVSLDLKELKGGRGLYTVSIKKDGKVMSVLTFQEFTAFDIYKKLDSVKAVEKFLEKPAC